MTTASLAKKIAFRAEHTGDAGKDRAQRQAQAVTVAHEQTKSIVAALMNHAYVALTTDTTITVAAYATLISTTITTVLDAGHIIITVSGSGYKTTAVGTTYFEVLVDGVVLKGCSAFHPNNGFGFTSSPWSMSMVVRASVSKGSHTVAVKWKTDANSDRINAASVVEEHAHLLVQEAL